MNGILQLALGGLRLRDEAFLSAGKSGPAGLRRAAVVVLLTALVAGLGSLVGGIGDAVTGFRPDEFRQQIRQGLVGLESNPSISPEVAEAIRNGVEQGIEIGIRIAGLPTPLPRPLISIIGGAGAWLGRPFVLAASWLAYALMTLVAARLLGGKGSLPAMLGGTALSNVPYALTVFSSVQYCGGILALAAWVWSSIIFVKATAVVNDLPIGRAVIAWAAPAVVMGALWSLVIALGFGALIVSVLAAAGG